MNPNIKFIDMGGFVSYIEKPLVVTSQVKKGCGRDTTYDHYVDYLDPVPENNKIKKIINMDHYDKIRQPLDAKPPHLEQVLKDEWPKLRGVGELQKIVQNSIGAVPHDILQHLRDEQNIKPLPITVAILSWASHSTLRNTLQSYKDNGLFEAVQEVIIFFQEVSETDLAIAEEFGITNIVSSESNIGIGPAIVALVEQARCKYLLFLENDWPLERNPKAILKDCVDALDGDLFDFIRLRSTENPGDPLYTRQFEGRELDCPQHLLDAQHWLSHSLVWKYPNIVSLFATKSSSFVYTNSFYGSHTNNPAIFSKGFYLQHIAPFAGSGVELEGKIIDYWRSANFKVAHNIPSLFTHQRLDR